MTIAVRIENLDTVRSVKVTVNDHNKDTGKVSRYTSDNLKPGASHTYHVHLLRDLTVEEVNPTGDP